MYRNGELCCDISSSLEHLVKKCNPDDIRYLHSLMIKQHMVGVDFLGKLPRELSYKILILLDCKSLLSLSSVNRTYHKLSNLDSVWKAIWERYIPNIKVPLMLSYKEKVQYSGKRSKQWSRFSEPLLFTVAMPISAALANEEIGFFGTSDYKLLTMNLKTGILLTSIETHSISCLKYSEKYHVIAVGSFSREIKLYDSRTLRSYPSLLGHMDAVSALCFEEELLYSGGMDGTLIVWNWKTGFATLKKVLKLTFCRVMKGKLLAYLPKETPLSLLPWTIQLGFGQS
jgi:WD40 repeat protein